MNSGSVEQQILQHDLSVMLSTRDQSNQKKKISSNLFQKLKLSNILDSLHVK